MVGAGALAIHYRIMGVCVEMGRDSPAGAGEGSDTQMGDVMAWLIHVSSEFMGFAVGPHFVWTTILFAFVFVAVYVGVLLFTRDDDD